MRVLSLDKIKIITAINSGVQQRKCQGLPLSEQVSQLSMSRAESKDPALFIVFKMETLGSYYFLE